MEGFKENEYVWAKNRTGKIVVGKVLSDGKVAIHLPSKRQRMVDVVPVYTYFDKRYQNLKKKSVYKLDDEFEERSMNALQQQNAQELLKKVLSKPEHKKLVKIFVKVEATYDSSLKGLGPTQCFVCRKKIGRTIVCAGCGNVGVHRKCKPGVEEGWYCELNCSDRIPEIAIMSPIETPPTLTRNSSSLAMPDIDVQKTLTYIIDEAARDEPLLKILTSQQLAMSRLKQEIENKKYTLRRSEVSETEYRLQSFKLQELEKFEQEKIKADLIEQLECAHIKGFESLFLLRKQSGSTDVDVDEDDVEKWKQKKKQTVERLLYAKLPDIAPSTPDSKKAVLSPTVSISPSKNICHSLLDKSSENSIHKLLEKTYARLRTETEAEPYVRTPMTYAQFYGSTVAVHDATIANCAYYSGKRIEHVGAGTSPKLMQLVMNKIIERYGN